MRFAILADGNINCSWPRVSSKNYFLCFCVVVSLSSFVTKCSEQYSAKDSREPSADSWVSFSPTHLTLQPPLSSFLSPHLTPLWYSALKTLAAMTSMDYLLHLFNSEKLLDPTWVPLLCAAALKLTRQYTEAATGLIHLFPLP